MVTAGQSVLQAPTAQATDCRQTGNYKRNSLLGKTGIWICLKKQGILFAQAVKRILQNIVIFAVKVSKCVFESECVHFTFTLIEIDELSTGKKLQSDRENTGKTQGI